MKRLICALLCIMLLPCGALASFDLVSETSEVPLLEEYRWLGDWERIVALECVPVEYLARKDYKWSLLDADGNVMFRDALDYFVGFEENGVATISTGGGWGYMRRDGSLLLDPELDEAGPFGEDGLARVEFYDKVGYINLNGEYVVEHIYDYGNNFYEGYAAVGLKGAELGEDESSGIMEYEQLWGLIDTGGNVVLPLEYDSVEQNDDGFVSAYKDGEEQLFHIVDGRAEEVTQVKSGLNLDDYKPNAGKKVAELDGRAEIEWNTDYDYPRLDGATALLPVYAALAQASYPGVLRYGEEEENPVLTCTKTNRAYERLIEGSTDIIFCAEPSDEQLKMAKAEGVEFEMTPFGREAFVFIVHRDNPLEGLTLEQIRQVYGGKITQWSELGVEDMGGIVAYQRPKNSGSQTALEALMGDVPLMQAPHLEIWDMGTILETIEYRNLPNALGYTFRFFCTDMVGSEVKLLAIDGVAPTVENIRNDSYPISSTLYAVTRKGEENPNVQIFLDWMLSAQGRELIEKSGYVAG